MKKLARRIMDFVLKKIFGISKEEKKMRRLLEITPEIEKHMVSVLDQALKSSGMAIVHSVHAIMQAIKAEEAAITPTDPASPPK